MTNQFINDLVNFFNFGLIFITIWCSIKIISNVFLGLKFPDLTNKFCWIIRNINFLINLVESIVRYIVIGFKKTYKDITLIANNKL